MTVMLRARIVLFAVVVPLLVRLPLRTLDRLLTPRGPRAAAPSRHDPVAEAVEAVLASADGRIVRRGCLTRGITRYFFLRRAGMPVVLRFGVGRPDGGGLEGHCWIEHDGEPYRERRDPRPVFAETWRIPRGAR